MSPLLEIASQANGYITSSHATKAGIPRRELTEPTASEIKDAGFDGLIKHCHYLYQQALCANTELAILRGLSTTPGEYKRDVICAPCFFSFARMAITESCFMNCARLYDGDSDLSIGTYLECCKTMTAKIDARARGVRGNRPGFNRDKPINHALAADEERFFQEEVESKRRLEKLWDGSHHEPVFVCLDAAGLLELWSKRLNGLSKLISKLREQRNKIYAHSDYEALDYNGLVERLPLSYGDMHRMVDLALDITIETNAVVSGIVWPRLMGGSKDLQGLLKYVDAGMEWAERDMP